ncbi:MAG: M24 family metallopeptidase [Bdellovibrionia bacterium]
MSETDKKLSLIRSAMSAHGVSAVLLRGVDWVSWVTGGGSSVVILTTETGVAQVLITLKDATIVTNTIERERLEAEEIPPGFQFWAGAWNDAPSMTRWIHAQLGGGVLASDRPEAGEQPLPQRVMDAKRRLLPEELPRYRKLGEEAAQAMREALHAAEPSWSEFQLAAAGSSALWKRGIHPTLTLVGGERRRVRYRHPVPTSEKLGRSAMLVFCARRHGLYANLTRFVFFEPPTEQEIHQFRLLAEIEACVFEKTRPNVTLGQAYQALASAYTERGFPQEELNHHQGGTTGYLSREVVALPGSEVQIEDHMALAWNPSLPGAKIEDTVVVVDGQLEFLTRDPHWPMTQVAGRWRPDLWVRL